MDHRRRSVMFFCLGIALYWAALYIYVPILSVYAQSLGASLSLVGLIIASYGVVQLFLRIPLGVASDRLGRRKPFVLAGFLTVALSCLGLALAPTPQFLVVFRALAGLAACTWVTSSVLFASYFSPRQAVRATSLVNFVSSGGRVLASTGGGMLAQRFGWASTFWAGAVLALLGLVAMTQAGEDVHPVRQPLAWRDVVRIGRVPLLVTTSLLATLSQYVSFATTYGFIPVYAAGLGSSRAGLGWLTAAVQIPYTLAALAAGRLSERLGERATVVGAALMMAVTTLAIPLVSNVGLLALTRVIYGIGQGIAYSMLMGLSIRAVPQSERASAMGIFQAVYAVGMFGGPAVSGLIADHLGLGTMFLVTGGLCLVMSILAFWRLSEGTGALVQARDPEAQRGSRRL
jgi:MFS family permease